MKTVKVLGININSLTKAEFEKRIQKGFDFRKLTLIGKVNSEFLLRSMAQEKFKDTLNSFDLNIADGVAVLWAAKYLKNKKSNFIFEFFKLKLSLLGIIFNRKNLKKIIPETIPGVEAMKIMLKVAEKARKKVYIFGGEKLILEKAISKIKEEFPKINIVGSHDGYNFKTEGVVKDIEISGAEMLFVALGSPDQEYWIWENINKLPSVKIAVGEGGSLDFIAGDHKRAPRWMQKLGLEWLFRLFFNRSKTKKSGSRLKRVFRAVVVFPLKVYGYKLKNNK